MTQRDHSDITTGMDDKKRWQRCVFKAEWTQLISFPCFLFYFTNRITLEYYYYLSLIDEIHLDIHQKIVDTSFC